MNKDYIIEGEHDEEYFSKIPRMTVGKHLWDCLIKHDPEAIAEVRHFIYVQVHEIYQKKEEKLYIFKKFAAKTTEILMIVFLRAIGN